MIVLQGKSVSRDICQGPLYFYRKAKASATCRAVEDREAEFLRYEAARAEAGEQLRQLYEESLKTVGAENAAIFEIHRLLLEDMGYNATVQEMIRARGVNAEYAVQVAGDSMAGKLGAAEDAYIRERALDIADISSRLLSVLQGTETEQHFPREPFLLAAEDLLPSETVQLGKARVLGFVLGKGGLHSHTAILAKSMGVPALVNLGAGLSEEYDGEPAILDGSTGRLYIRPDEETLKVMEEKRLETERQRELLHSLRGKENVTRAGKHIRLYANAGNLTEVELARENDAGGIGLLRSEILYLEGDRAPDEETQFIFYKKVLEAMEGKEVVIRTMDIGADKQVPYLNLEKEENPALGLRAIRLCLERPELLKTQLRALYRAGVYGNLSIMYPMVTSVRELKRIREIECQVREELSAEGAAYAAEIPTGIMIETPAAALLSEELAREVDFFSVGTNDLSQYTLALDRQSERLDTFEDPEHRAVLKLIEMAAKSAHEAGIPIGICGELASDSAMLSKFIDMGIDELSVAPGSILELRKNIREL